MKTFKRSLFFLTLMIGLFAFSNKVSANTNGGSISPNSSFSISISPGDTTIYTFNVPAAGVIVVNGDFESQYDCNIQLLNSDGNVLISDTGNWASNNVTGKKNLSMPYQVNSGTYYLSIKNNSNNNNYSNTINLKYTQTTFVSANTTLSGTLLRNEVRIYQVKASAISYFLMTGAFSDPYAQNIDLCNSFGESIDDDNVADGDWVKNNATGLYNLNFKTKSVTKGTYYIKITNKDAGSLSYQIKLSTKIPATKIKLNKTTLKLKEGKTYKLKATLNPAKSTDKLKWKSSKKKVATVNSKGQVKAKKKGTAYITVTATSGVSKKCKVTVK